MNKSDKLLTIFYLVAVVFVDFVGLAIVVTLFPKLILDPKLAFLSVGLKYTYRLIILGLMLAIFPFGQFIGAAIWGKLSDNLGRKPILLVTLFGSCFGFLLSGYGIYISSIILLFLSRFFSGLFSGNVAVAQASIIDISDAKTKGRNISLLQVILGIAWIVGTPLGGWTSQSSVFSWFSYSFPFWLVSLWFVFLLIWTVLFYHETLQVKLNSNVKFFSELRQLRNAFSDKMLRKACICWLLFVSGWWMFEAYLPTYLQQILLYTPEEIGNFLASMGLTYTIFQIIVMWIMPKLNPYQMVRYSLLVAGMAIVMFTFVHSLFWLHFVISVYVIAMAFSLPALITSVSNMGEYSEQGKIMGIIASIQGLATVLMMLIGGFLVGISENITIIGGGLLMVISWLMFMVFFKEKSCASRKIKAFCS